MPTTTPPGTSPPYNATPTQGTLTFPATPPPQPPQPPQPDPRADPARQSTITGRHHPATSHAAAASALPRSGTQRRRILDLLLETGYPGHTDDEIGEALRLSGNSVRPRRGELVNDGWVTDSGQRRPSAAGDPATVWTLTTAAVATLRDGKPFTPGRDAP